MVSKLVAAEVKKQHGMLNEAPASTSSSSSGRTFIRSTRSEVGHVVKFSGAALHTCQWETMCGWKYGEANFVTCGADAVNCARCKAALGPGGSQGGRGRGLLQVGEASFEAAALAKTEAAKTACKERHGCTPVLPAQAPVHEGA